MDAYTPALPPGFVRSKSPETETNDQKIPDISRIGPIGPIIPSSITSTNRYSEDSDSSSSSSKDDSFKCDSDDGQRHTPHNIGPVLPPGLVPGSLSDPGKDVNNDDVQDDEYTIGPRIHKGPQIEMTPAEEIEMRAQRMKDKLLKKDEDEDLPVKREEWMLSLPDKVKKKVGIHVEAKSNFSRSKCTAERDETWTETPAQRELREQEERDGVRRPTKRSAEDEGPSARDIEMHNDVVEHNKKHKRGKSLLEIHQKEMDKKRIKEQKKEKKKEKKARKKALKEGKDFKAKKPSRVPFDRERDLQANAFDDARKKSSMKKNAGMSSRFGAGSTKYL